MTIDCLFQFSRVCNAEPSAWMHYCSVMCYCWQSASTYILIDFSLPLTFHLITHRKKKILERLTFASKEWLNQNPNMSVLAPDKTFYLITKFAMLDVN